MDLLEYTAHPLASLVIYSSAGLTLTALLSLFAYSIITRIVKHGIAHDHPRWVFEALLAPAVVFVWVVGLYLTAGYIQFWFSGNFTNLLADARSILILLLLWWFGQRLLSRLEPVLLDGKRRKFDVSAVNAAVRTARVLLTLIMGLLILQVLDIPISGFLTFGGIGTVIIGLASQSMLANFFGGLTINLDRPFKVGDWIRAGDGKYEGIVEDIGWRLTKIRTFERRPIYVPNSTFMNAIVENASRMSHRRVNMIFGVRYDDIRLIKPIISKLQEMVENNEDIDLKQTNFVRFHEFGSTSLDIRIYAFTKKTGFADFAKFKEQFLLSIAEIVLSEGAEFAFPTQTLHIPEPVAVKSEER